MEAIGVGKCRIVGITASRVPTVAPVVLRRVWGRNRVEHRHPKRTDLPEDPATVTQALPSLDSGSTGLQPGDDGGRVLVRIVLLSRTSCSGDPLCRGAPITS